MSRSKAAPRRGMIAGFPLMSTQYTASALNTGTTTTAAQARLSVRGGLVVLPEPMMCSDIWTYASGTVPVVGAGSDSTSVRLYPADPVTGAPIASALPFFTKAGPSMLANGDKQFTPASNIYLPQMFWAMFNHDYATTAPTILSWQSSGALRSIGVSTTSALPASTPVVWPGLAWTEADYNVGSARAWGNATVSPVSTACFFAFKKA